MSEENVNESNLDDAQKMWEIQKLKSDIDAQKSAIVKSAAESAQIALKSELLKVEIAGMKAANEKAQAEADTAKINLMIDELEWKEILDKHAKKKAVDDENFLYRFGNEVSSQSVTKCISKLTEWHRIFPKSDIEIIFSSPGGSIIDGFELFDFIQYLRNEGHKVSTGTLGYAASMAGILLQAGDTRWIGQQAWLMIHRAAFGAYGKTFEIEDEVKFVKRIEERILDIFICRSKLTKNKIKRNWERKDWWISAEEALELELVDEIRATLPEHKSYKDKK